MSSDYNTTETSLIKIKMLQMAEERGVEKTFCPSDIARNLYPDQWRDKMELIRTIAQELADQGHVRITQKGEEVSIESVKGPIRIGKKK